MEAAQQLAAMGPRWVLVKGGHMKGGMCSDVLLESSTGKVTVFEARFISSEHTHGTGCTLASRSKILKRTLCSGFCIVHVLEH